MKPVVVDIGAGLGGWSGAFIAEGWTALGIDIERHPAYPGNLVIQDVRTVSGRRMGHVSAIVCSMPCQDFTRHMMPWTRRRNPPPPDLSLIEACWRIHQEASESAGRRIPFLMENVREAQRWIGAAAAHYGSRYLWGDVPALLPFAEKSRKEHLSSRAVAERSEIPFDLAQHIATVFKPR